ncbi:hypothetical protein NHU_00168 [Rhodovulum sulfidophilum]|uniref:Uncharacterized protein n=1 Tax=Rhodovulum sulfidophilum TaxID=35806 RepID=A0A0D6AY26_RHOSU|nr:hypothetical protein NHU_00168 [Rhodovulum sulfidophilum]
MGNRHLADAAPAQQDRRPPGKGRAIRPVMRLPPPARRPARLHRPPGIVPGQGMGRQSSLGRHHSAAYPAVVPKNRNNPHPRDSDPFRTGRDPDTLTAGFLSHRPCLPQFTACSVDASRNIVEGPAADPEGDTPRC